MNKPIIYQPAASETCQPCPACDKIPTVELAESLYDGRELFWLQCAEHGHSACGEDLTSAIKHWNIYITGRAA